MGPTPSTAESSAPTATVFIVDDDADTRETTAKLVRMIGFAADGFASGQDFLDKYDGQSGCLVLDVQMPGLSGVEVQLALNRRDVHPPIIFVTGHGDVTFTAQAMRDGALDVFTKPFAADVFLARIQEAIQVDLASRQKWTAAADVRDHVSRLTPREREVAELLASGESCKQIAHKLSISAKTIENYRTSLLDKMGVDNPTQLAHSLALLK